MGSFNFIKVKMVQPLTKPRIVEKKTKAFNRHQSDRFIRVNKSWRKPRGIDSVVRRRFKGKNLMPSIGYGSAKKTRNLRPDGFHTFRVFNANEVDMLLMHNRKYAAEIGSNVSSKVRKEIVARASQLNVKVVNGAAKLRTEEQE